MCIQFQVKRLSCLFPMMLTFCLKRKRRIFLFLSITVCFEMCFWFYIENLSSNNTPMFRETNRNIMENAKSSKKQFRKRHQASVDDRQSFILWKEIKVKPENKKGNAKNVRFGEPLQLYSAENKTDIKVDNESFNASLFPKTNGLVDCRGLFLGNQSLSDEMQATITAAIKQRLQNIVQMAKQSCNDFFLHSGYVTSSLTSEEATFPIAFSILVFKDIERFEILLRSIYRPQNVYCIHIDKKSSETFRQDVVNLIKCFDNVFLTSKSINVRWGTFGVLEPDIVCLRELLQHRIQWKYFINLTGQELPLRTNYELVRILKAFNGANNVEASEPEKWRTRHSGPPPYGVDAVKGAVHVILSRAFVNFTLHNGKSLGLYEWSKKTPHASEIYFSTLNFNPKFEAPGWYRGTQRTDGDKHPFLARLKIWESEAFCSGKIARRICILSPGELPLMATREELFANKLHFDYHPEMLVCMPELILNRTMDEYSGLLLFNDTYYKTRDFVKNRF